MARPDSTKLEEKNGEDAVSPMSEADINNGQSIINQGTINDSTCSKPEQNADNEHTRNCNSNDGSVGGDDGVIKQSPTNCEGSIANNGVPSSDTNPKDKNHARSISESSNHSTSEEDGAVGNVVSRSLSFVDGRDEEVMPSRKVQLFSCNQQPGNEGVFLKMVMHRGGLKVTTTGVQNDPHTLWITHYTVDGQRRQVVLFENERCSQLTGEICVLYTQEVKESADYILTGKKIKAIPERLIEIEPSLAFFKLPKAIGSEWLFLESLLSTKERKLLVGFDGAGQPIPLNKVDRDSSDFQAFFKILEAG
ncbi:Hypothetical predicted protein [Paramuricea clavata]|uniref:Uncharacterized protein n=1 Tax=Paramuricea clavata TaxID=317549 RepID=A0A7D9DTG8_PARCT|nr:Hypothetical predicted protein [Paramuricea clavata]